MTEAATTKTKEAAPKTHGGFAATAKITLGKNGEGKKYDASENNPKRKGSKSHAIFSKYRDGMTVAEAAEAGVSGADLTWDVKHGYISIA